MCLTPLIFLSFLPNTSLEPFTILKDDFYTKDFWLRWQPLPPENGFILLKDVLHLYWRFNSILENKREGYGENELQGFLVSIPFGGEEWEGCGGETSAKVEAVDWIFFFIICVVIFFLDI